MIEGLTIIITILVAAAMALALISDDTFGKATGLAMAVFGITAFIAVGKTSEKEGYTPSLLKFFFRPFAEVPDWVLIGGISIAAVLAAIATFALVDDYIHLPRRKKGGRI